ncbi:MAG: tetratricopeptide repeat protein [Spirochaetaceae bacterium]|nr:tetratricopeptide repeat protein [Spirochaetaceae bacterium]
MKNKRKTNSHLLLSIKMRYTNPMTALFKKPLTNHLRARACCCAAFICLAFCSCTDIAGKVLIARGSLFYSRGEFAQASGCFVNACSFKSIAPYAEYALGTAALAMDEGSVALEHFSTAYETALVAFADKRQNSELLYRIRYNSGIVYFQQGNFLEAAEEFKRALQINPLRLEAKHNLELCHLSIQQQRDAANVQTSRSGGISENKTEKRSGVLLDFMRQRETETWKSFEWGGNEDTAMPDY